MLFYEPGHQKQHGLRHDPFKAFVAPRPIGWISTVDADGRGNLAPYTYFNAVWERPPVVIFSSGPAADGSATRRSCTCSSWVTAVGGWSSPRTIAGHADTVGLRP